MSLNLNRETLHEAIEHLPENTLPDLAQFIAFLQFKVEQSTSKSSWPAGFFENVIGGWQGEPLERPEQGVFEERDALL